MTLTSKDKILLGLLAVILFAGLMFAYGILPANDELDTLEKQISEKQEELSELQNKMATINISGLDTKYDELLEYYYAPENQPVNELPYEQTMVDINRTAVGLMKENGLTGYSTSGWKKEYSTIRVSYDGYEVAYSLMYVNCATSFKAASTDDFYKFIDEVGNVPYMTLTDINLQYNSEDKSCSGTLTIKYLMKMEVADSSVPQLMSEVQNVTADGATVTFDAMADAVKYEFYVVTTDADGEKAYALIKSATLTSSADSGQLSRKITSAMLGTGTYTVIVRAVGNKSEGWFKTALGAGTEVTVTI